MAGPSWLRRDKLVNSIQSPQASLRLPLFQEVLLVNARATGQEGSPKVWGGLNSVTLWLWVNSGAPTQGHVGNTEGKTPSFSAVHSPAGREIKTDWGGHGFSQGRLPGGGGCLGLVLKNK